MHSHIHCTATATLYFDLSVARAQVGHWARTWASLEEDLQRNIFYSQNSAIALDHRHEASRKEFIGFQDGHIPYHETYN